MKKTLLFSLFAMCALFVFGQPSKTRMFTMFTSGGCGCTGSGGAPETFTTHEEVLEMLQASCNGIDFINWEGTYADAIDEVNNNKTDYDGVLIVGRIGGNYDLAFTGLPTIVVYNLFEFMDAQPYHLFANGRVNDKSILIGGRDYENMKILTAQLDRRNLCTPEMNKAMLDDLVYKIGLIKIIKELSETRILMVKRHQDEIIAQVNYRGGIGQNFPSGFNTRYIQEIKELFGVEIVPVEPEEFYSAYAMVSTEKAEQIANEWIHEAQKVEASYPEIVKTARAYLAFDALREQYNCHAVSTNIRTVSGNSELADRLNPGLGFELGFKTIGIQAVCQNYPDLLIGQILAYSLTGKPSMLGDFIYDPFNSVQTLLHCGIPINPYGGDVRIPYTIRTHAESPVRDMPEEPGSSTGITAVWPEGQPVTFWEFHSLHKEIRLHTGKLVDGHSIYSGGENLDNVMCTAKIVAKVDDIHKVQAQFQPYMYGIHENATLGDIREQIKDLAVLLGMTVTERNK